MPEIQIVKSKSDLPSAEAILIENGFCIISSWICDNRFKKDGQFFKLSHPIWQANQQNTGFTGIRIEVVEHA